MGYDNLTIGMKVLVLFDGKTEDDVVSPLDYGKIMSKDEYINNRILNSPNGYNLPLIETEAAGNWGKIRVSGGENGVLESGKMVVVQGAIHIPETETRGVKIDMPAGENEFEIMVKEAFVSSKNAGQSTLKWETVTTPFIGTTEALTPTNYRKSNSDIAGITAEVSLGGESITDGNEVIVSDEERMPFIDVQMGIFEGGTSVAILLEAVELLGGTDDLNVSFKFWVRKI